MRPARIWLLGACMLLLASQAACQEKAAKSEKAEKAEKSETKHSVKLKWFASSSRVDGYNIYRGTSANGPFVKINSAPVNDVTYVDQNVEGGVHYYYAVRSVAKGKESLDSNHFDVTVPSP